MKRTIKAKPWRHRGPGRAKRYYVSISAEQYTRLQKLGFVEERAVTWLVEQACRTVGVQ